MRFIPKGLLIFQSIFSVNDVYGNNSGTETAITPGSKPRQTGIVKLLEYDIQVLTLNPRIISHDTTLPFKTPPCPTDEKHEEEQQQLNLKSDSEGCKLIWYTQNSKPWSYETSLRGLIRAKAESAGYRNINDARDFLSLRESPCRGFVYHGT